MEDVEFEEVEDVSDEEDIIEGSVFRNMEDNEEFIDENNPIEAEEENLSEHKFEDIIWSDDKFPKN